MSTDPAVEAAKRAREALDSFTDDDIAANAVSDVITYADLRALLSALEVAEAERAELYARVIDAADVLSPGVGAMVGGRGLAIAARQIIAERDEARGQVERATEWLYDAQENGTKYRGLRALHKILGGDA